MKHPADKKGYVSGFSGSETGHQTSTQNRRSFEAMETALSESEAKFFLDRNIGSKDIDRKIFGADFERAKFHLQALRNLLNCRSYIFGRGRVRPNLSAFARLRKAESPKQGLSENVFQQHQASRNKSLSGVFVFPTNREESDLDYELDSGECGWKGGWSYCLIS